MQRLLGLFSLLILFAIPTIAQDTQAPLAQDAPPPAAQNNPAPTAPPAPEIVSRTEISGGFMLHRYNEVSGSTITMPGGYGDVEHNIIQRWLGVEIQGAGGVSSYGTLGNLSIYSIMAGPDFYPFGHRKITFFGHVLAGEGFYRDSIPASTGFPAEVRSYNSFAWTAGAGLDLRISTHLAVRLAQFDYTETKFLGGTVHENDTRISIGIVYHFGKK
jgi:hypothetical protein